MNTRNPSASRSQSFVQRRPIVTAGITCVVVTAAICCLLAFGLHGPEATIVVSPETTLITAPLAADGMPDYAHDALTLAGRGTPPADNAAVPLLEAIWPIDLDEADLAAVCSDLGIAKPDKPRDGFEGDNFLVDDEVRDGIESILEALGSNSLPVDADDGTDAPETTSAGDVIDAAVGHPWRSADLPSLASWLTEHTAGLDLVVEASRRPRLYLPNPDLLAGERGKLLFDVPPPLRVIQTGARGLVLRSMASLGDGRFAEAWSDILAVHRLSRLVAYADAGSLIGHLMVTAVSGTACQATLRMLDTPGLPAELLAAVRRDLAALPPWPEPRHSIVTERLGMLDFMIDVSRMPRGKRAEVFAVLESKDPADERTFPTSLDWNTLLGEIVADYALLEAALGLPAWMDRQRAIIQLEGREIAAATPPEGWLQETLRAGAMLASRRGRSRGIARLVGSNWFPAVRAADAASTRGQAVFEATRIAVALASWRGDDTAGRYPERLDDLVPTFLDRIPLDPFTDQPFHYERLGDGYLLYSEGQDGRDDRGTDIAHPIVRGEWVTDWTPPDAAGTDVVVRLPMPSSPLLDRIREAALPGR